MNEVGWTDVADAARVRALGMQEVEAGGVAVLLVAGPDAIHAVAATCPHQHAWLSMGRAGDGFIDCPRHQGRFRLADGMPVRGPPCPPLAVFPVRIAAGRVLVAAGPAPPASGRSGAG